MDEKWNAVLRLGIGETSCSAGLISPDIAMTAAHCFDGYQQSGAIQVYSGPNGMQLVGLATLAFVDPRYSEQDYGYDIALLVVDFLDDKAPSEHFTLASVEAYHRLLAGIYPNRTVLAAAHGLNENKRTGEKKAAFESQLSIFPWPGYAGKLFTDHKIGGTRPGDSGGPIFIATTSGIRVFGAVSGDNVYTYTDDDDDYTRAIIRNAPAIPSLCISPISIREQLKIDDGLCSEVAIWEERLYSDETGALSRLWRLAHAVESPLLEIEDIRSKVDHEVIKSFIQTDSVLAREYLDSRQSSWRFRRNDRELHSRLEIALDRRNIQNFEDIWTSDKATSDFIEIAQSADKSQLEQCGVDVCHEWFRTSGGIKLDSDSTVWDPVTSTSKEESSTVVSREADISIALCSFMSDGLSESEEFSRTTEVLEELGFSREFIGVSRVDSYSMVTASNSKFSFDLRIKLASRADDEVFLFAQVTTTLSELPLFSSSELLQDALSSLEENGFQPSASSNEEFKSYQKTSAGGSRASLVLQPTLLNLMVSHSEKSDLTKGGVLHDVFQC